MRRLTLFITLLLLLTACGKMPEPQPTLKPTPTPDTYQLALGNIHAQSTLEAVQATAQSISANLTATAYAPTQEAIGTATERAWVMAGWTATASVEQTATSASGTATQQSWQATSTQRAINITATVEAAAAEAQATALHGQAVSVELAVERERMMNTVQATAPWVVLFIVLIALLVLAFRWSKVRPIQRDPRGDAPLLIIDGKVYDADRNPYPLLDVSGKKPSIPALTPSELQAPTTARDQMIDLATRGIQGQTNPRRQAIAQKMAAQSILPPPAPAIQFLPADQARPLLGDVLPGIVRDAIDADITGTEQGDHHA